MKILIKPEKGEVITLSVIDRMRKAFEENLGEYAEIGHQKYHTLRFVLRR